MTIKTGTVKFYNASKGYGFIAVDGTDDIFFHISDLAAECDDPVKGDSVSFIRSASRDGKPRAVNVTVIQAVAATMRMENRKWLTHFSPRSVARRIPAAAHRAAMSERSALSAG